MIQLTGWNNTACSKIIFSLNVYMHTIFKALFQKEMREGLGKRASNWLQYTLPDRGGLSTFKYNTTWEVDT